jgi:amino acid transporter
MLMTNPGRKLAGTLGLLALLVVYSLLIMVFATSVLPAKGGWVATLFYIVAGVGWVPIAMLLVSWMYKHDAPRPRP